jgi:hypothetical protein
MSGPELPRVEIPVYTLASRPATGRGLDEAVWTLRRWTTVVMRTRDQDRAARKMATKALEEANRTGFPVWTRKHQSDGTTLDLTWLPTPKATLPGFDAGGSSS